jgi:DNA-binding beta-propeller fold protein YncE
MKQIRMPTGLSGSSRIAGLVAAVVLGSQLLLSAAVAQGLGPDTDILYVGDVSDNTVKRFTADTGESLVGTFVTSDSSGLNGPMGLLIAGPELIVVNQNFGTPNGEILQYQLKDGSFTGRWIPKEDPNSPFAPRGAAIKDGVLYVANFLEDASNAPGEIRVFSGSGVLLGTLNPPAGGKPFHPRGVVVGPDDILYVSSDPNLGGTGGQVLRFDPITLDFIDVFIDDSGGVGDLNRPEGLVFDPDGKKLYITSFRATTGDTDSIRIYHAAGAKGVFFDKIDLDKAGPTQARAFAQALLFGPGGKLFVPITNSGVVRRYDVVKKKFDEFVRAGALGAPFYLTFGRTDPATLAYPNEGAGERD